jgi:cysteinyl-tRNA synthetase
MAVVWDTVKDTALPAKARLACLERFDQLLALDLRRLADHPPVPEVLDLIERREKARASKDFKAADALRDKLGGLGYYVEDTPAGSRLVRK